jgi:ABC-type Fe3+ transport system permease subunit
MAAAARLLLIPIALLALLAALVALVPIIFLGQQAWVSAISQPGFAQTIAAALAIAVSVAVPALLLGLVFARFLQRASSGARALAVTGCAVVLLMPMLGLVALPRLYPPDSSILLALLSAVARAAALVSLVLTAGLARVSPGLVVAARAAGAPPFRAWRDANLAPLVWPLLLAALASSLIGFAAGPAAARLTKEFTPSRLWLAAPALLLAVASLTALSELLRRRPA